MQESGNSKYIFKQTLQLYNLPLLTKNKLNLEYAFCIFLCVSKIMLYSKIKLLTVSDKNI